MEYHFFKRTSFFFMMISLCLALLYYFLTSKVSLTFTYYLVCGIILCVSIIKFTMLNKSLSKSGYFLDLFESLIGAIVGVIAINFGQHFIILSIVLGITYLIVPTIKLFRSQFILNQLFLDSFKFFFGFVLMVSNDNFTSGIKYVFFAIFLILFCLILISKVMHFIQSKNGGGLYE